MTIKKSLLYLLTKTREIAGYATLIKKISTLLNITCIRISVKFLCISSDSVW